MANYQTKLNLLETEIAIKFIKDNFAKDCTISTFFFK